MWAPHPWGGTAQVEAGQLSRRTARGVDVDAGLRPRDLQAPVNAALYDSDLKWEPDPACTRAQKFREHYR